MTRRTSTILGSAAAALWLGLAACAQRPAEPAPAPLPQPEQRPVASAPAPDPAMFPDTLVCVVERGSASGFGAVSAKKEQETGRVLVMDDGQWRPLADRYPATGAEGYAGEQTWYVQGDPITLQGGRYVKVGVRRVILPEQLKRVDMYDGVLAFADQRESPPYTAVYFLTEPGCVFQAYAREEEIRRVRG